MQSTWSESPVTPRSGLQPPPSSPLGPVGFQGGPGAADSSADRNFWGAPTAVNAKAPLSVTQLAGTEPLFMVQTQKRALDAVFEHEEHTVDNVSSPKKQKNTVG